MLLTKNNKERMVFFMLLNRFLKIQFQEWDNSSQDLGVVGLGGKTENGGLNAIHPVRGPGESFVPPKPVHVTLCGKR